MIPLHLICMKQLLPQSQIGVSWWWYNMVTIMSLFVASFIGLHEGTKPSQLDNDWVSFSPYFSIPLFFYNAQGWNLTRKLPIIEHFGHQICLKILHCHFLWCVYNFKKHFVVGLFFSKPSLVPSYIAINLPRFFGRYLAHA